MASVQPGIRLSDNSSASSKADRLSEARGDRRGSRLPGSPLAGSPSSVPRPTAGPGRAAGATALVRTPLPCAAGPFPVEKKKTQKRGGRREFQTAREALTLRVCGRVVAGGRKDVWRRSARTRTRGCDCKRTCISYVLTSACPSRGRWSTCRSLRCCVGLRLDPAVHAQAGAGFVERV